MKMTTPTGEEMIQVREMSTTGNGLVLEVTVMRSMQMSVVLTPAELRRGISMLNLRLLLNLFLMLFRKGS